MICQKKQITKLGVSNNLSDEGIAMNNFEILPKEVVFIHIIPYLTLSDILALRSVNKRISAVFSSNQIWREILKNRVFHITDLSIPERVNYFQYLIHRKQIDQKFEHLLVEAKVYDALVMLFEEGQLLLHGLFKITKRDVLKNLGVIHDARQSIRILLGLEKWKLAEKNSKGRFKISVIDFLEIEYSLTEKPKHLEHLLFWLIQQFIERSDRLFFKKKSEELIVTQAVKEVIFEYFRILQRVEKIQNRWKNKEGDWKTFTSYLQLHCNMLLYLCEHFELKVDTLECYTKLQVEDPSLGGKFSISVDFGSYKYQFHKCQNDHVGSHWAEVYLSGFDINSEDHQRMSEFESSIRDINNSFKELNRHRGMIIDENTFFNKEVNRKKRSAVAKMIKSRSFRGLGNSSSYDPRRGFWIDNLNSETVCKYHAGSFVISSKFTYRYLPLDAKYIRVVFGRGFKDLNQGDKMLRAGRASSLVRPHELSRAQSTYVVMNLLGKFREIKGDSEDPVWVNLLYGSQNIFRSNHCDENEINLGSYFSHYDARRARLVKRPEIVELEVASNEENFSKWRERKVVKDF